MSIERVVEVGEHVETSIDDFPFDALLLPHLRAGLRLPRMLLVRAAPQ